MSSSSRMVCASTRTHQTNLHTSRIKSTRNHLALGLFLLQLAQFLQLLTALFAPFVDVHLQLFVQLSTFLILTVLQTTENGVVNKFRRKWKWTYLQDIGTGLFMVVSSASDGQQWKRININLHCIFPRICVWLITTGRQRQRKSKSKHVHSWQIRVHTHPHPHSKSQQRQTAECTARPSSRILVSQLKLGIPEATQRLVKTTSKDYPS